MMFSNFTIEEGSFMERQNLFSLESRMLDVDHSW